jgi:hypothetical protein
VTTQANPIAVFSKDPGAELDYTMDWQQWMPPQDRIVNVTWTISPAGTLLNAANSFSTTDTTIWLSAGTDGLTYDVTCEITTNEGRIDDRTFRVEVVNR